MSDSSFSLHGKVAIVTGAANGIGLASARLFLSSGVAGLALVDISRSALEQALDSFTPDERQRCLLIEADVADENSSIDYVRKTVEKWGRVDISVQNAGIANERQSILDTPVELWDKTLRVNGRGVFLGIRESARAMLASSGGGSIVVISSQLGLEGAAGLSAYSSSKFAARGLALTTAEELGPKGIRVNCVCPGPIETPLLHNFHKSTWPMMAGKCVLNRLGQPEEIARAVLFLASDASSYCVGTTLKVDGGYAKFG